MNANDESSDQMYRRVIKYDSGHLFEAESWRVAGTLDSDTLQWRFIGPRNYALVVRPVQIKSNERILSVPSRIEPAYGAVIGLILLVHERISVVGGPEAHVDTRVIDEESAAKAGTKARDELKHLGAELWEQAQKEDPGGWRKKHERLAIVEFKRSHGTKLAGATKKKQREQFVEFKKFYGKTHNIQRFIHRILRERHQSKHPEIWAAADAEDKVEREEYERLAAEEHKKLVVERERFYREVSLYDLNEFIGRHAGKKPVAVKSSKQRNYTKEERDAVVAQLEESKLLNEVYQFIRNELKPADPPSANIVHQSDCRQLVMFLGDKLGKDLRFSVLKDFNRAMAGCLEEWGREVAMDRDLTSKEAERFLLERVQFMAECEGRAFSHFYPIEDIQAGCDVHEKADDAPYEIHAVVETQFGSQLRKHVARGTRSKPAPATPEQRSFETQHPLATDKSKLVLALDENNKKTIFFDGKSYSCQPYHWEVIAFCDREAKLLRAGKTLQAPELLTIRPDGKIQVSMRRLIEKAAPEKASRPEYLKHGTFFKEMDTGLKKKLFGNTGQQHLLFWLPT